MSLEYTIDIQLTELGFPDILQTLETPARESPGLLASQYVSLSGSDPQTKPIRQPLQDEPSVTSDKCTSRTPDTSGSSPAPRNPDTDRSSRRPRPVAGGAAAPPGPPAAQHLPTRGKPNEKSHEGVNSKQKTQDAEDEPESTDDSEVSENDDEESLDEDQDGVDDESDGTGDYRCAVCDLQLQSNMQLQDHMNLHTGQRPHCCAECGKRFCQLNNYRAHLKTHAKAKHPSARSVRCRICRKDFRSEETLKAHLTTTHFEKEFYECDFCKRVFTDRKECEQHIEWHKSTQGQFVCDTCGRRFANQRSLKRHRPSKCQRSFVCTDCKRTFSRKNALLKHSFSHVGLLPYTCLRCSCHFRLARLYRQHKCEPQRIHCAACLRVFPSHGDFQKHKKDTGCWGLREPKGDEIRCPECGESFATKEELKKHGGAHQRILTCAECGKGFRSALLLMSHMGGHAVHTPCLCQSCGRGFLHQQDYDSHLERCGLAPLPPTVPKKRAQKSSAPPGKPTPLPAAKPPMAITASTSGADPTSRVFAISNVPAPSPENRADGSWRLTLDKPPPLGLNLVLFVPVNSPLATGLVPAVQQTRPPPAVQTGPPPAVQTGPPPAVQTRPPPAVQTRPPPAVQILPPTPAVLDAAVELHKSTSCPKTSSVVGSPRDTDGPLNLVANKTGRRGYVEPLDLSNKLTPLVPADSIITSALSIKTEACAVAVSFKAPAVNITAPTVSIEVPTFNIKAPDVEAIAANLRECRVVLRKLSAEACGVTGGRFSCVNWKTVGHTAHHNVLATVKPEPVGPTSLVMDIKEEPESATPISRHQS